MQSRWLFKVRQGLVEPKFSIGVTTYRRPEMLRQCLTSILTQEFKDFEILVGNDDVDHSLFLADLGMQDTRIRIINHPQNLGEIKNMNFLLKESSGQYFTWLADDDLFSRKYLSVVNETLENWQDVSVIYYDYRSFVDIIPEVIEQEGSVEVISGASFLDFYLKNGLVKPLGCYGMFKRADLLSIGGMEMLGDIVGYSDNLLAIYSSHFAKVAYINQPLIYYRLHGGSASYTVNQIKPYLVLQQCFFSKSLERISACFGENNSSYVYHLLVKLAGDALGVFVRSTKIHFSDFKNYMKFYFKQRSMIKGYRLRFARLLAYKLIIFCYMRIK